MAVIIIASEVIRYIYTSQPDKFSKVTTMIMMVLVDLCVYATVYDITSVTDVVTVLGFVLLASVSCNLLYNYIVVRFGYKGIIFYRLITALYVYFIPVIPNVYLFFRSFFRMVYPFVIYLLLEYSYSKTKFENLNFSYCPICNKKLEYNYYNIEEIGDYYCPSCKFKKPIAKNLCTKIDYSNNIITLNNNIKLHVPSSILYYIYNTRRFIDF